MRTAHIRFTTTLLLVAACGACGGGGGTDPCVNSKNIDGDWVFDLLVTKASGPFCSLSPGDYATDFGPIIQGGRAITYYSASGGVYTGEVCGKDMSLYLAWTPAGSSYSYDELIVGQISPDAILMTGTGRQRSFDSLTGELVCSVSFIWDAYEVALVGGGDGQNGASAFNNHDEATALVLARSTDSSTTRLQILGSIPPGEFGDFALPPGFWDLYLTYPSEQSRLFERAAKGGGKQHQLGWISAAPNNSDWHNSRQSRNFEDPLRKGY